VLLRRTRLGVLAAGEVSGPDSEVPERVARALAGELGWDEARTAEEAERFRTNAQAEGILPA
jgi:glycerol-3-phosphate dehydrogenase